MVGIILNGKAILKSMLDIISNACTLLLAMNQNAKTTNQWSTEIGFDFVSLLYPHTLCVSLTFSSLRKFQTLMTESKYKVFDFVVFFSVPFKIYNERTIERIEWNSTSLRIYRI